VCRDTADLKPDQFFDEVLRFVPHDRLARDIAKVKYREILDPTANIGISILLLLQETFDIHLDM